MLTFLKPDGHEWKNKNGLIHFLIFDFKLEQKQKEVEKSVFLKALFIIQQNSQNITLFSILFGRPVLIFLVKSTESDTI